MSVAVRPATDPAASTDAESGAALGRGGDPTPIGLDPCLARLDAAITSAAALGVATGDAEAVRSDASARLGFPSDRYVVALVGGTGVGKSSLLNALAGTDVSPASARRPTTGRPIAWLGGAGNGSASSLDRALAGLFDWLGVDRSDVHAGGRSGPAPESDPGDVAILDLPDLDSTAADHRARVETILPRVDAVVWVTDPEKYHDAVLHDDFLARWVPRLGRQVAVVNKADRLTAADAERVRADLGRDLARFAAGEAGTVPAVVLASATDGVAGVADLRAWLGEGVQTKHVVRGRLIAAIRDAVRALASEAGIDPTADAPAVEPLVAADARRAAVDQATTALLRIVDLPSLQRQAVAATRAGARARGAGPLGGLTSRIYAWSGRKARVADPVAFLARWRDRGSLAPAVEPIRAALAAPLRTAPAGTRRILAETGSTAGIDRELGAAVDRAVALRGRDAPTSRWWPVFGLLQTVSTLALVVIGLWVALWVLVKFPVDSVAVPVLGRMPSPFIALLGVLAAGYLVARLLGLHAGWVGRRWARRLAAEVRRGVEEQVAATAFSRLDGLDDDRRALATTLRGVAEDCAPG